MPAGSSFGELALISSKPRAATIRTKTPCHFAKLDKDSYQKVLMNIQEKMLNEKIDFFKALPVFESWTRVSLGKMTYFFFEKDFQRNHFVYKEGDSCTHCCKLTNYRNIDIVLEGEFQASKEITLGNDTSQEDELVTDFIKGKNKKSITRFQKEKLKNLSNSSSERSMN